MKYKHVVIRDLGGSEVLQVFEDELPEPKSGEVRVRILTAGVSYADMRFSNNNYLGYCSYCYSNERYY